MTNTKIIFGGIVAIAAIIASPILAEAITGLDSTSITTTTEYNIEFTTNGPVATDGSDFGGFAIFTTGGDVIAVTSHKGVYDSEGQAYPNKNKTFDVCSNGNISEGYCDAAWHAHIVQPVEHPACAIAAVGSLTYEEPGSVNITGNVVSVDGVPIGTTEYINSITGASTSFTVGSTPVLPNPVSGSVDGGVGFPLVGVFDGKFKDKDLVAVCIGLPA